MASNTGPRGFGLIPAMLLAASSAIAAMFAIWLQLSSYIGAH